MAVRIAIVGVGFGALVHAPAFQSEGLDVVALCARNRERAERAAQRLGIARVVTDFDELLSLPDLDAVSITTPGNLHHDMTIAALRAGKHVICEKPFARNAGEAREMLEEAEATGLTAMVAHEFRFASARMRVKELLEEGYLGQPTFATVRLLRGTATRGTAPADYVAADDSAIEGGGFLFRMGSHYIDALRHWFGEVVDVDGRLLTTDPDRTRDGARVRADADDTFFFTLRFADGTVAEMVSSRTVPFVSDYSITIAGTDGVLTTPQATMNPPAHGAITGARFGVDPAPAPIPIPDRLTPFVDDRDDRLMPFRLLTREFLRGIESGTSPSPNFEDGYRCMQVLDAVRQSSASGQRIVLAG